MDDSSTVVPRPSRHGRHLVAMPNDTATASLKGSSWLRTSVLRYRTLPTRTVDVSCNALVDMVACPDNISSSPGFLHTRKTHSHCLIRAVIFSPHAKLHRRFLGRPCPWSRKARAPPSCDAATSAGARARGARRKMQDHLFEERPSLPYMM